MEIFYKIILLSPILLYTIGLLFLFFYICNLAFKKIAVQQNQAKFVLNLATIIWIFTIPTGFIILILSVAGSGNLSEPSDGAWFAILLIISALILPLFSLSNIRNKYRQQKYLEVITYSAVPYLGIITVTLYVAFKFLAK